MDRRDWHIWAYWEYWYTLMKILGKILGKIIRMIKRTLDNIRMIINDDVMVLDVSAVRVLRWFMDEIREEFIFNATTLNLSLVCFVWFLYIAIVIWFIWNCL